MAPKLLMLGEEMPEPSSQPLHLILGSALYAILVGLERTVFTRFRFSNPENTNRSLTDLVCRCFRHLIHVNTDKRN